MNRNRVRVITDGAIIIAIYLVVLIFSRFFGGISEEFIYFLLPIPLCIYGYKYSIKETLITGISIIIASFILISPLSTCFYVVPTICIGIIYPELLKKKIKIYLEMIILISSFLLMSLFTSVFFAYLFNYDLVQDTISFANEFINLFVKMGIEENKLIYLKSIFVSLIPCILLLSSILEAIFLSIVTKLILYKLKLTDNFSMKLIISLEFMPKIIGYIYILVFGLMIFSFFELTKENNLFLLYSIIANIGVIYSFFMIYQGIYFLAKYAKIKRKYCLYVLGIISIFIFPIIMIVLGTLQNILHLSMKINFIK